LETFAERLSTWGIDNTKQVVVYDTTSGSFAVRLWWLLRLVGHEAVAVLDGGFEKWKSDNHPIRSGLKPINQLFSTCLKTFLPTNLSTGR